ncbi:MAG: hypothetical protein Q9M28_10115 [Mariprofundaceae bacterium]|nr:hypothetical protein [Mariprofundaceae bacterium]
MKPLRVSQNNKDYDLGFKHGLDGKRLSKDELNALGITYLQGSYFSGHIMGTKSRNKKGKTS